MAGHPISAIPTICVDRSTIASMGLFNPNDWPGTSKGVVQSCATEHSVIGYGVARLTDVCETPEQRCRSHINTLRQQWLTAPWDLEKSVYFAEVPEVHLLIEAFFSSVKSLLDLIVQLVSTEGIVGLDINGFHRKGDVYGGKVLNALDRNAKANRAGTAAKLSALIREHKNSWINEVIGARDLLVHPNRGAHQLMFEMSFVSQNGELTCTRIVPPRVGERPVHQYAAEQLENVNKFARTFLAEIEAGGIAG